MADLTFEQLKSLVAPYGNDSIIRNTVVAFNKYADICQINTPLRKAHFLAQIAHESDSFKTTVEYGGASKRYAPWFGRGLIQVTWEANYIDFYEWCVEQGFEDVPEFFTAKGRDKAAQFVWAFLGAVWYWQTRNLNNLADEDNVRAITKSINGGYNGLDDRMNKLNKAKKIFGVKALKVDSDSGSIVTKKKYTVSQVQNALVSHGFSLVVDGKMGEKTIAAVKMFQKLNDLVPDGVLGPKTEAKLFG